jgi:hypothetical protein
MPDTPELIRPLYGPAQLAKMLDPTGEIGITARSIRTEIEAGRLKAVKFAGKLCIRHEDAIERLGGLQCQSETRDRGSSSSSPSATPSPITSSGGTTVAESDSVQRARAISRRLKKNSKRSSTSAPEGPTAPVTPLRS